LELCGDGEEIHLFAKHEEMEIRTRVPIALVAELEPQGSDALVIHWGANPEFPL